MKALYSFLLRLCSIFVLTLSLVACAQEENESNVQNEKEDNVSLGKEEILFIGNSHTYYNQGVATHLSKFRDNDDLSFKPLITDVARGGFTLQDHLMDQSTLDKINERSWDAIILQENTLIASETLPETTDAMISISEMVKQKGTKVFLFMTWPYRDQGEMLTGIRETYQKGFLETGATIVPVGLEWQSIDQNADIEINLYDLDGIHPSLEGTFYSAAMFYKAIYDKSPSDNPYLGGLGNEVADYLKTKAD